MASLREKSGHYYARFYDPNRSPKQKEKALRTTRKRVARKRLVKWEKAYEEGEFDPWRDGWLIENDTVPGAIERFLDRKRRDGLQESTIEAYEYKLNAFAEHTPPGIRCGTCSRITSTATSRPG